MKNAQRSELFNFLLKLSDIERKSEVSKRVLVSDSNFSGDNIVALITKKSSKSTASFIEFCIFLKDSMFTYNEQIAQRLFSVLDVNKDEAISGEDIETFLFARKDSLKSHKPPLIKTKNEIVKFYFLKVLEVELDVLDEIGIAKSTVRFVERDDVSFLFNSINKKLRDAFDLEEFSAFMCTFKNNIANKRLERVFRRICSKGSDTVSLRDWNSIFGIEGVSKNDVDCKLDPPQFMKIPHLILSESKHQKSRNTKTRVMNESKSLVNCKPKNILFLQKKEESQIENNFPETARFRSRKNVSTNLSKGAQSQRGPKFKSSHSSQALQTHQERKRNLLRTIKTACQLKNVLSDEVFCMSKQPTNEQHNQQKQNNRQSLNIRSRTPNIAESIVEDAYSSRNNGKSIETTTEGSLLFKLVGGNEINTTICYKDSLGESSFSALNESSIDPANVLLSIVQKIEQLEEIRIDLALRFDFIPLEIYHRLSAKDENVSLSNFQYWAKNDIKSELSNFELKLVFIFLDTQRTSSLNLFSFYKMIAPSSEEYKEKMFTRELNTNDCPFKISEMTRVSLSRLLDSLVRLSIAIKEFKEYVSHSSSSHLVKAGRIFSSSTPKEVISFSQILRSQGKEINQQELIKIIQILT